MAELPAPLSSSTPQPRHGWWREPALLLVISIVALLQGARLADQPIRGEESRWALGALEMMRTQDWIVPRQQGTVFPERPPLNSWLMALAASVMGSLSPLAVRLPSLLATIATSVLLYHYVRRWRSANEAACVALIYPTLGQVLQLGHLGESEAVLTALIAGSLLLWHSAWLDQRPLQAWIVGFSLAALAALTKGLQGPIYFLAVTSVYLAIELRFQALRTLVDPRWWCGLILMLVLIAAWAIPFVMDTDLQAFRDIWAGLIVDRVGWSGWLEHLTSYPLEILGCWLPWSLFLVPLTYPQVRAGLKAMHVPLKFALIALAMTFPSVWLVTGARGRYFMPLAPMAAIVLGTIVITLWNQRHSLPIAQAWWRFVRIIGLIGVALAAAITIDLSQGSLGWVSSAWLPSPTLVAVSTALGGIALLLFPLLAGRTAKLAGSETSGQQPPDETPVSLRLDRVWQLSFLGSVLLVGWIQAATLINLERSDSRLLVERIEQVRELLPDHAKVVSFGPVHHRFGYLWGTPIMMQSWPSPQSPLPDDVDWFVLDFQPTDSPLVRVSGRGRTWGSTSGTLPFSWEVVASVPIDFEGGNSHNWVIVGRILRDPEGNAIRTAQGIPAADQVMR